MNFSLISEGIVAEIKFVEMNVVSLKKVLIYYRKAIRQDIREF